DDQLSLAIGKEGQNVRLASKLSGWKIDLIAVKEIEKRDKLDQKLQMDISEMYGVTPRMAQKLKGAGILTVQKLHRTPIDQLVEIEGVGAKTAEKLKNTATETMVELNKALEDLLKKELQEVVAGKPLFDEAIFGPETKEKKKVAAPLTEADLFRDLDDKGAKKLKAADAAESGEAADEVEPAEESTEEEIAEEISEQIDTKDGDEDGEESEGGETLEAADDKEGEEPEEGKEPEEEVSPEESDDTSGV
ncbi:MAG: helix-hairpin-helix domain-containing protein, partial [Candidatus Krumholzibacteriia bacterium]